ERNRTPFTSLQGYSSLPLQALSYATPDDVIGFNGHSVTAIARTPDTSPPLPGEPLYLLNNSLLI
ncbi:MAG TPA: hypothetical protein VMM37_05730, partial [Bacteroidota bacterium]|nr:hypothetical protein [Bacteroidota bacterium]